MRLRKQIVGQHIHKRNVLCLTERRMARPPQVWGQFSRSVVSDPLWPQGLQHARPPCPSPTPRACSNYCPLSWWYHPTISSSVISFSSCPQSFPYQGLFKWVSFSHQVVKVLEFHLQHQSFQWTPRTDFPWDGLVGSPCSPRDSQESCPASQKSINSSALSFLYGSALTSIHDYGKNQAHSLQYLFPHPDPHLSSCL